jgi:diadenosine tetraphosphate (Ap4A) HIT family hydrolase
MKSGLSNIYPNTKMYHSDLVIIQKKVHTVFNLKKNNMSQCVSRLTKIFKFLKKEFLLKN